MQIQPIPIPRLSGRVYERHQKIARLIKLVARRGDSKRWALEPRKCLTLGQVVRGRRESLRMFQRELAKRAQIAQSTVSKLECGLVEPKFATLVLIARALDATVSNLLNEAWGGEAP